MNEYKYSGQELETFLYAQNWKSYWSSRVMKYMGENILEVGAGIGTNTEIFSNKHYHRWVCLEPDTRFAEYLTSSILRKNKDSPYNVIQGTIKDITDDSKFDTILYIDVLEHVEYDKIELQYVTKYLDRGGAIIILVPAHSWLFSKFDKAIGHYRRYNKKMLSSIIPRNMKLDRIEYLDSVGLLASVFNRFLLKSQAPSIKQVKLWDSIMIPGSIVLDRFFKYSIGKSILGVIQHA